MNSLKEKMSFWLSSELPQPGRKEKFLFNTPQHFTEREEDTSVLQQEVERGVVWVWTQVQKPGRLEQDYLSRKDTDMLP